MLCHVPPMLCHVSFSELERTQGPVTSSFWGAVSPGRLEANPYDDGDDGDDVTSLSALDVVEINKRCCVPHQHLAVSKKSVPGV